MKNIYVTIIAVLVFTFCRATKLKFENGYIFTCSRSLNLGEDNELNLQRFGDSDAGVLKVTVSYKQDYNSPNDTILARRKYDIKAGDKDVTLNLHLDPLDNIYNGKIQIEGKFGDYKINGSDSVQFSTPKKNILIIQTDKPIYQPGQIVKFRVLKVDKNLKPIKDGSNVDIFVQDPKDTRLFQFLKVNVGKGIIQREFPLSDQPVEGTWSITVKANDTSVTTTIDVKKYVLPKFEVKIKFPPFVLSNAENIKVDICAEYTYGKPVVGTLKLNASLETYSWIVYDSSYAEKNPILQETVQIDGCYTYDLNVSKIELDNNYSYRRIEVVAVVTEEGTGVTRNATAYLDRTTSPLNLNFAQGIDFYKPGLPYNGKCTVTNPDNTPAKNERVQICATIVKNRIIAKWAATRTIQTCRNYTSNDEGIILYSIAPQNTDVTSINLEAKSLKYVSNGGQGRNNSLTQPQAYKSLGAYYSPSKSFIQLQPVDQPVACGSVLNLKLLFTSEKDVNLKFYYQVKRQGSIVYEDQLKTEFSTEDDVSVSCTDSDRIIDGKIKQINPPEDSIPKSKTDDCPAADESQYTPFVGEVEFDVSITAELSPAIYVLIYYVRPSGEVVADSAKYVIQDCFSNQVDFKFRDQQQQPGLDTEIEINAAPNSLCGIKVVDKSITLLDNRDQLTPQIVFRKVAQMDTNIYYDKNPCYDTTRQPGLGKRSSIRIIRPPIGYETSYEDSFSAFATSGNLVISDLLIVTRPCPPNQGSVFRRGGGSGGGRFVNKKHVSKSFKGDLDVSAVSSQTATISVSEVRSYFPETWLFELEMTDSDGVFEATRKLPDTITQWIGSAVCISSDYGLGISNTTSITAFQAFFIDYTLPVSAVRGEEFTIVVTVFNYVDDALPITISLDDPTGFEVVGDSISGDICVQSGKAENLRLTLKATQVGQVNITVRGETSQSSSVCGDSPVSDSYAKDAIVKPITVEAEGFRQENVINTLFCLSDENSNTFETSVSLTLPKDVVPDSESGYMDFTGDIMGPAINNLNNLVTLPTGCGEQNMVKLAPNYEILIYLQNTGSLTDDLKRKIVNYLVIGYQRELTYRHPDGSFSAFGTTDPSGSMFLTAFVLKTFTQIQAFVDIDPNILKSASDWIVSKQDKDGCFPDVGRIIDIGIQGGLTDQKTSGAITAYVLASLLQAKVDNATVVDSAFQCLDNNPPSNPYSQNLYAYAYAMAGKTNEAQGFLDEARQRINSTDGMVSYNIVNGTEAIKVEANAYSVETILSLGGSVSDALPYIRYLTKHLNPNGGFQTTQATCVGLNALSKFASLIYEDPLNIEITTSGGLEKTIKITEDNKLLVQRYEIEKIPTDIDVVAKGTGCGLIQTLTRYNTETPPEKKLFSLDVNGECLDSECTQVEITVLTSYTPDGQTAGMSIIQIKLITGYAAESDSLNNLKSNPNTKILRVDVEDNTVIIYVLEISNTPLKFSFLINKVVDVLNPQPGIAVVYDYYANENSATTNYIINPQQN